MTASILPTTTATGSNAADGSSLTMSLPSKANEITADDSSDYGDFTLDEQEIIHQLLTSITKENHAGEELLALTDIEDYEEPSGVRLPRILGKELWNPQWVQLAGIAEENSTRDRTLRYNLNTTKIDSTAADKRIQRERSASIEPQSDSSGPDLRSPIERFRTKPKKALSVTDLVSPAWCELQYFYTLSKHGKKRATPAMRQGTKTHKKLEDEVHTTVPVSITTKEDSWGLRIWNIIQGLRTLRETGMTRELEVWGVIHGQIVNGVIDELTYECPDPRYEEREAERRAKEQETEAELPAGQTDITDYLLSPGGGNGKTFSQLGIGIESSMEQPNPEPIKQKQNRKQDKKIYITDVKTRSVKSLPSPMASRPTEVQLQLYHSMITSLAKGDVPLSAFAARYNFDPTSTFSDPFIAQVGSLNEQFFDAMSSQSDNDPTSQQNTSDTIPPASQDSMDILLQHNTIQSLWTFMISQFQETFLVHPPPPSPLNPSDPPASISTRLSPLLTASYIHPATHTHLGNKSFIFSASALATYLADEMAWWHGERKARGVDIQEVSAKCTRCEFLAECEWVKEKERDVREAKGREKGAAAAAAAAG